jgi:hypothetical protein
MRSVLKRYTAPAAPGDPGKDIYHYPRLLIQALHDDSVNRGAHVIQADGGYDSHLLVPVQLP